MPPRGSHTVDPTRVRQELDRTPEQIRLDELVSEVYGRGPLRFRRSTPLQPLHPRTSSCDGCRSSTCATTG